jgi:hypothetical protein
MDYNPLVDSILAATAIASTIMLLGAVYLLILRTPKFQYSLRFLLLSIGCIAAVIGLWTALLRTTAKSGLTGPGINIDTGPSTVPTPERDSERKPRFPTDQLNP